MLKGTVLCFHDAHLAVNCFHNPLFLGSSLSTLESSRITNVSAVEPRDC